MCFDENNKEVILFGKGIGFEINPNEYINIEQIDKIYEIKNKINSKNYQELAVNADEDILEASEVIISKMIEKFGNEYNEKLHISLLDYLLFAVKRYKENIYVGNIFLDEIEYLYPKEYKFSKEMLEMVNDKLKIQLPNSEAGFICMHIHSGLTNGNSGVSAMIVKIVGECIRLVESETGLKLEDSSVLKQRLVTHLKFAIKRAIDGISLDNPIEEIIKDKYITTYNLAKKISEYIKTNYDIQLTDGEISYLTIHIQNIINSNKYGK